MYATDWRVIVAAFVGAVILYLVMRPKSKDRTKRPKQKHK
jgi:hypothetical protein